MQESAERLRTALSNVVRGSLFDRSPTLLRALRFLVETEASGNGTSLTPYRVAVEAFGKPSDFDPSASASVRVEMNRLRRLLSATSEESPGETGLCVPAGSYRPQVVPAQQGGTSARKHRITPCGQALVVLPALLGGDDVPQHVRIGLASLLVDALARSRELLIVQPFDLRPDDPGLFEACADVYDCQFMLRGEVWNDHGARTAWVRVALFDVVDRSEIWGGSYELTPELILGELRTIAADVARRIGDPVGAITMYRAQQLGQSTFEANAGSAELCLRFRLYRAFQRDPVVHLELRNQVEALLARDPWFPLGWMMLGLLALDEFALRYNTTTLGQDCLARARASLDQALAIEEGLAKAVFGLSHVAYFERDFPRCRELLDRAMEMNPNDMEMCHAGAMDLCLGGAVEDGMALLARGGLIDHAAPGYRLNGAMCLYATGDVAGALELVERLPRDIPRYLSHLVTAIIRAAAGKQEGAAAALRTAISCEPALASGMHAEVDKWILDARLAGTTKALLDDVLKQV